MNETKIKIPNERLWDIANAGEDIDQWLRDVVGYGNWYERIGIAQIPYRCFLFKDPKHATMFALKWL
jgi:hypothetical protein